MHNTTMSDIDSGDLTERYVILDAYEAGVEQHLIAWLWRVVVNDLADPRIAGCGGEDACTQEHFALTQWMCRGQAPHDVSRGEHQRRPFAIAQDGRTVGTDLVRLPVTIEAGRVDAVAGTDVEGSRCQL